MPADDPGTDRPTRAQIQRNAVRGATWTMAATAITIPLAFVANVVLARVLGVEGYGRLAFLTAALEIVVAVTDIGTTAAVIQFGSRAHALGQTGEVQRILARAQGFRLLIVAPVLSLFIVLLVDLATPVLIAGVLLGVWLPAALAGINDCLTVENRTATAAKIQLAIAVVIQTAVVVAALLSQQADSTWLVRLALTAVSPLVAIPLVTKAYRSAVLRPRSPRGLPSGFWKFAIPSGTAGLIGGLVVSRSEVLLLEWLDTPNAVGLFALAFGIAAHVFGPANALTNPLLPAVSSLRAVDADAIQRAFLRVTRVSVAMVSAILLLGVPALAVLVDTIYGAEYRTAAALLVVLAAGIAVSTLSGPVTAFNLSRLASMRVLFASLIALIANAVLAVALIPMWSIWGAAIASVLAAVTRVGILVRDELIALELGWAGIRSAITALATSAIGAGLVWWTSRYIPWTPAAVATAVGLGAVLWWATLRCAGATIEPGDRQQIVGVLPRPLRAGTSRVLSLVTR
ncbi:oligosaccharide flippase family protein [Demetria terragena]|uniref:oligosaccharide flippase family protein n=1 Tax=Demetria terragena TaxID=63959 RepID=UPI0003606C88|nr:oligosaccharide flippase family protein [Demetria terragena]